MENINGRDDRHRSLTGSKVALNPRERAVRLIIGLAKPAKKGLSYVEWTESSHARPYHATNLPDLPRREIGESTPGRFSEIVSGVIMGDHNPHI